MTAGAFEPPEVVAVLWALATMGVRADRGLLEALGRRAASTVRTYTTHEVVEVLWALAVMGRGADGILGVLRDRLAARVLQSRATLSSSHKCRVHQWLLSCELNMAPGAPLPRSVARVKQEMGEECLLAFSGQRTHESRLQQKVAAFLASVVPDEFEIVEEYLDPRSGLSIDILVRPRSACKVTPVILHGVAPPESPAAGLNATAPVRHGASSCALRAHIPTAGSTGGVTSLDSDVEWAVEVDGPTHFLGVTRTPSAKTLLKRKRLGQLGYTMVPVPFFEWRALKGEAARRRYLADKLRGG